VSNKSRVVCHECGAALSLDLIAKCEPGSRVGVTINPAEGQFVAVRTAAETMLAWAKMTEAIGDEIERHRKTVLLLESVSITESGGICFRGIITFGQKGRARKAR